MRVKVETWVRNRSGRVPKYLKGVLRGEALPEVYRELGPSWPWIPRFISELVKYEECQWQRPDGKEWHIVIRLTYEPKAPPTAKLFIGPPLGWKRVPPLPLVNGYPLTVRRVRAQIRRFLKEQTPA